MSAPSYAQLADEVKIQARETGGGDGPMNFAVYDDLAIPDGAGTPIESLVPMVPLEAPEQHQQPTAMPQPPKGAEKSRPLMPAAFVPEPRTDGSLDDKSRASLLVFALYLIVSSNAFQSKMGEIFPEVFGNPTGAMSYLARGLVLGLMFYLVQRYMVAAC